MINTLIADPFREQIDASILENAAQAALNQQGQQEVGDITIAIDNDQRLQELNSEFLGIDTPTDVLSFPSGEDVVDPETGRVYLGDIIISYPRAAEQAAAAGHDVRDEIQLLVVHGVLHLLGHDHAEPEEKERMWSAQSEILKGLDVRLNRLPD